MEEDDVLEGVLRGIWGIFRLGFGVLTDLGEGEVVRIGVPEGLDWAEGHRFLKALSHKARSMLKAGILSGEMLTDRFILSHSYSRKSSPKVIVNKLFTATIHFLSSSDHINSLFLGQPHPLKWNGFPMSRTQE